ncbi:MAG: glycosyltransferase [Thermodesulfobacteriota bacterium]
MHGPDSENMTNVKKILFVAFDLEIGGAEWVILNLCNEFVENGVHVTLITNRETPLVSRLDSRVKIIYSGGGICSRAGILRSFVNISGHLKHNRYHAVFATQRWISSILSLAHCITRSDAQLVIRESATNFAQILQRMNKIKQMLIRTLFTFAYRRADLLIANSEGTFRSLKKNRLVGRNKAIVVINNPVDIGMVQRQSLGKPPFDLPKGLGRTIVSIGRLSPQKRMQDIILAVKVLRLHGRNVFLFILGEGSERLGLERLVEENGLNDVVKLTGKLDNPYPILKAADVFVLASKFEGFGMVIVEALALGVPVVATDIPDGPQCILNFGEYGKLYPVGNIDRLVENIEYFLEKRPKRETLVSRAKDFEKSKIASIYMKQIGLNPL